MSRRTKISMLGAAAVASAALASPATAAVNTFSFDAPAPGTLGDTGFTTVLPGSDLALERVSLGGGALSVTTSEGDAWRNFNDQENALAVPVANGPAAYTVRTTILLPPAPSVAFQSAGIVVGVDEDNYVKAVLSSRGGQGALNFVHEQGGVPVVETDATRFSLGGLSSVTITLTVEASGRVTPQFQLDGGGLQPIASPAFIDDPQFAGPGVTAGIITTDFDNRNALPPTPSVAPSLTFRFDEFVLDNPNQTGALPAPPPPPPLAAGVACTIGPDTTAPTLTITPQAGAKVARTPTFVITANEPVLVPRSAVRLVGGDGRSVAARVRLAPDSRQIRVVPTVPLDVQKGLSLIVSGGNDRDAVADTSCNRTGSATRAIFEVPGTTPKPGEVSVAQLRINQRISQAALLREKAIRERLDGDLIGADLQTGSFGRSPFGAGVTVSGTDAGLLSPSPGGRVLDVGKLSRSSGTLELTAGQLLINQRISQAAVRRVNALQARLDAGLRGSDLAAGAVSAAKLSRGLSFSAVTAVPPAAPPALPSPSAPSGGSAASVKLTAGQLLINQRISQAAVRRLNAIRSRLDLGLVGEDFQAGTVTGSRVSN